MFKKITGLLALVLFITLTSCSSDSDGENTLASGSISATIDGQSWASINGGAIASVTDAEVDGNTILVLQIIAMKTDQSTVTMQFPISNLSTGTFTFTNDTTGQLSYFSSSSTNMFSSTEDNGSFTVTLTEVNTETNKISGTFSGTLVDFMGTQTIEVTNGVINNVTLGNTNLHSNGTMSFSKNGSAVTLTDNPTSGTSLWIYESSFDNSITVTGTSTALDNNFGIYALTLPKDVAAGTYNLTSSEGFEATYGGSNEQQYNTTQGSITIVSHVGNTIVATFNYTANNNGNTVNITNGELTFEHKD